MNAPADFNETINGEYRKACETPSDINEHLPILRELAQEAGCVTEFGVRGGVSTRAFLAAGCNRLRCYDLEIDDEVRRLVNAAHAAGRDVEYHQADVLRLDIDETGLLFIDTLHTYGQLSQELELHAAKARRYIAMHDTDLFGLTDETLIPPRPRGLSGLPHRLRRSVIKRLGGTPIAPPRRGGLLPAVLEFMAANRGVWQVKLHKTNNNGLTVLERSNNV